MSTATTTARNVGKGQSKGMRQGREAAAKATANGQRVADINAERAQLNRTACVTYLQSHGVYSGHSRDGIDQLRVAVAEHQASLATTADLQDQHPLSAKALAVGAANPEPQPTEAKARTARPVPDDHPQLRYVDAALVGTSAPEGLVHSVDSTGLVRAHKPKCKPNLPALAVWPDRVYAAACCKPRTPGATARSVYVPPSKRTA